MQEGKPNLKLPPLTDEEWPAPAASLKDGFAGKLNVYRVMAHHPALLCAWADLRDHVVVKTSLGPERSEVVILRTGVHLGSDYEWNHHVTRARRCGFNDARIASLRGDLGGMEPEDATLARAVDELFDTARLSSETVASLEALVGKEGILDVIATVGFYSTLGYILNSFHTPLDGDIAQHLAERPFEEDGNPD